MLVTFQGRTYPPHFQTDRSIPTTPRNSLSRPGTLINSARSLSGKASWDESVASRQWGYPIVTPPAPTPSHCHEATGSWRDSLFETTRHSDDLLEANLLQDRTRGRRWEGNTEPKGLFERVIRRSN